jgi:hypothetical protein
MHKAPFAYPVISALPFGDGTAHWPDASRTSAARDAGTSRSLAARVAGRPRPEATGFLGALRRHWPEYLMEAAGLGAGLAEPDGHALQLGGSPAR